MKRILFFVLISLFFTSCNFLVNSLESKTTYKSPNEYPQTSVLDYKTTGGWKFPKGTTVYNIATCFDYDLTTVGKTECTCKSSFDTTSTFTTITMNFTNENGIQTRTMILSNSKTKEKLQLVFIFDTKENKILQNDLTDRDIILILL